MKPTILIADDEPHIARILSMALERAGYSVTTVKNGLAALEQIRKCVPDVLISDIEMPKMDGRELLDTVVREYPNRQFRIFIMTSRTNLEYRAWSEQFSDVFFLEKPVSTRRLITVLEETMGAKADS